MENINWKEFGFGYTKTDYNVRCHYRDGKWGELEVSSSDQINVHIASTGLHYGQQAFEGLKAFKGPDGKVRVFRIDENGKRLQSSSHGIMMAEMPLDLFREAVIKAIKLNERWIPPYESGASLYIRPVLFGNGAQVGVKASDEYTFAVFVMPVGPYFKEGFKPTDYVIYREYDRAAPQGTGIYKVGGNYAASLRGGTRAHDEGFSAVLFLDAKEKKYIDECGPANFFGIKDNTYVTPKSNTILPSITNKSLCQIAEDLGMNVERRPITVEELADFSEAGACGTAAVISPIRKIVDADNNIEYKYGEEAGERSFKLYETLRGIQYGTVEDKHNWNTIIEF
ncbi:branched-chain amino acid aminotransferase [Marinifilum sp. D737]|jgi:branched-chain amino acid aminotransferase|uniref:branched-chain amino acid aminotransferase n=1 Tax=Marinifilum sp. D737 TaxID=2969628 RepID=UPI0022758391|nr:branched-chain amino acid aminotransferase [Marinifilum sp. D737]MCY1635810.1 branched-chain amino acid aminotransferase [Marinifilum sp. D737]